MLVLLCSKEASCCVGSYVRASASCTQNTIMHTQRAPSYKCMCSGVWCSPTGEAFSCTLYNDSAWVSLTDLIDQLNYFELQPKRQGKGQTPREGNQHKV